MKYDGFGNELRTSPQIASRATRLRVDQIRAIDHFVSSLSVMFPEMYGVAVVGSSLERDDYRDVDLRIVLDDEHCQGIHDLLNVEDLNALLSRWGQQVTGLPIDCQIQPQWEHLDEAFGPNGKPRHHWRGSGARRARANPQATTDP